MTPDTLAHIRADVQTAMVENRNDDPALLPDLLNYLLTELGLVSIAPSHAALFDPIRPHEVTAWITQLLERVQLRAVSQIPMAEADACDQADDDDWSDHR